MRLELFHVSRRWPRQRTQSDDEISFVNSGILFTAFCSIRRPYITFKLPRGDMDTHPRLRNSFRYLAIGMCHFRYLWNGLCDDHWVKITVMQFTLSSGASLWSGTFPLSHIISRAHLRDFFRLLAIGMCHFRYLRNGRCDRHRAEITIMQFIGHSLPVHHFFYGTVRIFFTLSHIVSQAEFTICGMKKLSFRLLFKNENNSDVSDVFTKITWKLHENILIFFLD